MYQEETFTILHHEFEYLAPPSSPVHEPLQLKALSILRSQSSSSWANISSDTFSFPKKRQGITLYSWCRTSHLFSFPISCFFSISPYPWCSSDLKVKLQDNGRTKKTSLAFQLVLSSLLLLFPSLPFGCLNGCVFYSTLLPVTSVSHCQWDMISMSGKKKISL